MKGGSEREFETVLKREAERTRGDLSRKLGQAERTLLPLAGGGLVVLFGLQLIALSGVLLLGRVMSVWLAALLLGASSIAVGAIVMVLAARRAVLGATRSHVDSERDSGEDRAA